MKGNKIRKNKKSVVQNEYLKPFFQLVFFCIFIIIIGFIFQKITNSVEGEIGKKFQICGKIGRILVSTIAPLMLIFIMTDFKCSRKKAFLIFTSIFCIASIANIFLYIVFGHAMMMRIFSVIVAVPCLIALFIMTNNYFAQIIFNFFTSINVLCFVSVWGIVVGGGEENTKVWIDLAVRIVFFSIFLFLIKFYLMQPYRFLIGSMKKGWRVVSVIPVLFFGLVMFLGLFPVSRSENFIAIQCIYIIFFFVYVVIYQTFQGSYSQFEILSEKELLMSQVIALQKQSESILDNSDKLKILRHDMRHYTGAVLAYLHQGEIDKAIVLMENVEGKLAEITPSVFCQNSMINVVISLYMERMRQEKIQFECELDIPEQLLIDTLELAVALSNGLENALNECAKIPEEKEKFIRLKSRYIPNQLAIELCNTCAKKVELDENGVPVSKMTGHGIGTRSIAAFAKKYHAMLQYQAEEDLLTLYMLIDNVTMKEI